MRILAFDVAVTGCAVGILDTERGLWHYDSLETERGQAEMLIPIIDTLVQKGGWCMSDIDRIAVTTGPGSFTGVRIGLATARSLGLALDIPVFGQTTLNLTQAADGDKTLVLIDTKRGDYYGQVGHSLPQIYTEDEARAFTGTVIKDTRPDLKLLATTAAAVVMPDGYDRATAPTPLYLRDAEISQPKKISPFAL